MTRILFPLIAGLSLSLALPAFAAEKAAAVAAVHKAGDKVFVCGCGAGCGCNTLQAGPGKCHCGKDLVEGTVTKASADSVTVKTAAGEQVVKTKK